MRLAGANRFSRKPMTSDWSSTTKEGRSVTGLSFPGPGLAVVPGIDVQDHVHLRKGLADRRLDRIADHMGAAERHRRMQHDMKLHELRQAGRPGAQVVHVAYAGM